MAKAGKNYRAAADKIEAEKLYSVVEAAKLAQETSTVKFDATVEIHCNTNADPRHADQIVRATISLPHGTGRKQRIAVFCETELEAAATKAGADLAGSDELIAKVAAGEIDFDVAVATPSMMRSLSKVARVLGPKGLMPSPKNGTVTVDVADAVAALQKGRMEFKTDKQGIIHSIVGKAGFKPADLAENVAAFLAALDAAKPSGVKGKLIKTAFLSTAMGPSIQLEV